LLVSYHFPLLVQHLDRVLPGWETASFEEYTTTEVLETPLIAC
jgi:hypothetical protein